MLWVCRSGKEAIYLDYYLETDRIYLPWDGFKIDLNQFAEKNEFRQLVCDEKTNASNTAISTWLAQLYTFCKVMKVNDYVLIPHKGSREYALVKVIGNYEYDSKNEKVLWHSRQTEAIVDKIPRDIFSQSLQYSLGAYRTIFKIKDENELMNTIVKWNKEVPAWILTR